MNEISQPFTLWEAILFAFLNSFPYIFLGFYAYRTRWRFRRGVTFVFAALITLLQTGVIPFHLFTAQGQEPLLDVIVSLLYVLFIFLCIKDHVGKLVFSVLVLNNLGNLVIVLAKCIEGQLFPDFAPLRYHFTFMLTMLLVQLILLPLIYLIIFRDITAGDGPGNRDVKTGYIWRYLWLVPAIFYLIWMQHFYNSGKTALENALDVGSTAFLLLIDAGSVLIYRLIVQLERVEWRNRRLMAENHALNLQSVQYDSLRKRMEETRRARHDLRHHVMLLKSVRSSGDLSALDELLASYPDLETLDRPLVYCENEMVNAVLAHFGDEAEEKGIRYTVKLDLPEDVFVEKPDLAVLFGNLLENAVEAASHGEGEKFITVSGVASRRSSAFDSLTLLVENSCSEVPEQNKAGVFLSTKHSGEGIGIESVKSIVERYGGVSSFVPGDGVFTVSVVLYPHS